jgi:hypothetical protein
MTHDQALWLNVFVGILAGVALLRFVLLRK